jgi:hypothetical protein
MAIADGRWHRFGASVQSAERFEAPIVEWEHTPPAASANAVDGRWHHFGEGGKTAAKANSSAIASSTVVRMASK